MVCEPKCFQEGYYSLHTRNYAAYPEAWKGMKLPFSFNRIIFGCLLPVGWLLLVEILHDP